MRKLLITDEIKQYFKSKPQTLNMYGFIKNYPNQVELFGDGNNYALIVNGTICCFDTTSLDFVDEMCRTFDREMDFCGISKQIFEHLGAKYNLLWVSDCGLFVWNGKPLPHVCVCDVRDMDASYRQDISDGTPYHADLEEIDEAIANRPSSAVYVDGKPVCWCIIHSENSLGMLYTKPEHRRKGYALEVMTSIVNKQIAQGDVPYCYIITGNVASEALAPKYNLQYVEPSYWTGIDFSS